MTPAEWTAHALARNDRYLIEFVEAYDLCPFAKRCRESSVLERRVVLGDPPDEAEIAGVVRELEGARFAQVEVALLLLPEWRVTRAELDRFTARARDMTAVFFVVAFHPEAEPDLTTPDRLVPFLRRSPDPTLQLVRRDVLDRARGWQVDKIWLDPRGFDLQAPPPIPPPALSERIAGANHETVQQAGVEHLRALLEALRMR